MNSQKYKWIYKLYLKLRYWNIKPFPPLPEDTSFTQKRIDREWRLFDEPITKYHCTTIFPFIDQYETLGSHNTQLVINVGKDVYVAAITLCNLNKYVNEKTIINTLIHESLHIAICFCLGNQSGFIENVINDWMMKSYVVRENNNSPFKEMKEDRKQ